MSLGQFWSSTPRELWIAAQAYNSRAENQQRLLAWHAANIMNMWSKRRIRPDQLMGKKSGPQFMRGGGPGEQRRFEEHMRQLKEKND